MSCALLGALLCLSSSSGSPANEVRMYIRNVAAKSTKIDAINRRMMNEAMVWPPANR